MNRVLIVSRNFPPAGAVGIERIAKFVRYLPQYGWQPTVLTATRGAYGLREDVYLAKDVEHAEVIRCYAPDLYGLYKAVAAKVRSESTAAAGDMRRVYKPRGPWHPKAWIVPDSHVLWIPIAICTALRFARRYHWKVVLATISPATNALIGYQIARHLGIPLVLDYRDPWSNAFFSPRRPTPLARLDQLLEKKVFSAANAITTLDPVCLTIPNQLVCKSPPVYVIPNGYDEDDFKDCIPMDLPFFSIVHTGQLSSERSLASLWAVLNETLRAEPGLRGRIHVWQVGTVDAVVEEQMKAAPEGVCVHHVPPVTTREAISYMLGADLLLVQSVQTIPAKIYPYLRAGRPILALREKASESLNSVIASASVSFSCDKNESTAASGFVRRLASVRSRRPVPLKEQVSQYSRRQLTGKLAEVLAQVAYASSN